MNRRSRRRTIFKGLQILFKPGKWVPIDEDENIQALIDGLVDLGGREEKPIELRSDGKSLLSTNMLINDPDNPGRFRLGERFRKYFERGSRSKKDIKTEIERLKSEIDDLGG